MLLTRAVTIIVAMESEIIILANTAKISNMLKSSDVFSICCLKLRFSSNNSCFAVDGDRFKRGNVCFFILYL